MTEVRRQIGKLIKQATPKGSRFVIFIDDLDRCRPPRSVDVLEVINPLLNHSDVIVMVMSDMQVVKRCAEIRYRSLVNATHRPSSSVNYGWDYLQKVVQLQFDLPTYPPEAIRRMVRGLARQVPEGSEHSKLWTWTNNLGLTLRRIVKGVFLPTSFLWLNKAAIGLALLGSTYLFWLWKGGFAPGRRRYLLIAGILTVSTGLLRELIASLSITLRRRAIDRQIRAQIARGERDFSKVEATVRRLNRNWRRDPQAQGLLRERLQRYLEDESELQREAEDEVIQRLEPMPRHAKRLLNRLRLLLFIAHERRMFGGHPVLSPRHIGKWAVLSERWPELAQVLLRSPELMLQLEDPDSHHLTMKQYAPLYGNDKALEDFCLTYSETPLADVMDRIVQFRAASAKMR
jgi:hypothetical protein